MSDIDEYSDLPEAQTWVLPHHVINRLQENSIKTVVDVAKGGYRIFQADWIKHLSHSACGKS